MGRLIDADKLLNEIEEAALEVEKKMKGRRSGKTLAQGCLTGLACVREAVKRQPPAYDPDKVVEQLEERTAFLKDCTKYGNKTTEQQSKSYDTMMMYEVKDLVDDLLEIVKAGGSDA